MVQQDANFTYDNTLKRLGLKAVGTAATDIPFAVQNSAGTLNFLEIRGDNQFLFTNNSNGITLPFTIKSTDNNSAPYIRAISNGDISEASLIATRTGGSGVTATAINRGFVQLANSGGNLNVLSSNGGFAFSIQPVSAYNPTSDQMRLLNGNLSIGTGYTGTARLDVRAQGALSTDIAFRVRNSADSANLFTIQGDGDITLFRPTSIFSAPMKIFGPGGSTIAQFQHETFGSIALGLGATFDFQTYGNVAIGQGANTTGGGGAVSIGLNNRAGSSETISIGYTSKCIGAYAIKIGSHAGASSFGGTNSIHLGRTTSGNDVSPDNVFMTYFNSQSSSTLTRSNGSFGLLGQQAYILQNGTGIYGTDTFMGNGGNTLVVMNHTAVPSTNITNAFQLYSNDITAGNAAPHFRTENGSIVKLYQETTGVAAATFVANTSGILNDTATFDGYTIGQVVKVLRNLGILA